MEGCFWEQVLENNLVKTKVMVSGHITDDGLTKSKVDPCGVCSLRVKIRTLLCVLCGKKNPQ